MRRVCILTVVTLALGVFAGASAHAQTQGGEQELGFLATFTKLTEGDDDGFLFANVRYGYFVTAALQVGGGLAVGGPIDDISENVNAEVFGAYYFDPEATDTFYVRAGYSSVLDDFGNGFADGAFGYKSYLNERAAFFWEGGYGFAVGSDVDGGSIRSVAGITFLF